MKLSVLCLTLFSSSLIAQTNPLWTRYPAISPDGQSIAFCYHGDIYKVPASGGAALQMTSHSAYEYGPIWSNDGQQLAFASDRYGNSDIFVMSAAGGNSKRLTYHSNSDVPSAFSPDNTQILFTAIRQDRASSALFPTWTLPELYSVPANGGAVTQILGTPAEEANYSQDGTWMVYHDKKGYEDPWRKHHTSSVTRDIWLYNTGEKKHTKFHHWMGEDREPVIHGNTVYFLSERETGSFNIWKSQIDGSGLSKVTDFKNHPVRFLSVSNDGVLCYFYDGRIYTQKDGGEATPVDITILTEDNINEIIRKPVNGGATQIAVSPNGKELAFVSRGEVYVTSVDHSATKRITNTAQQERSVSFSPDGRKLLYASERNGSWNIYESEIKHEEEKYFFLCTELEERGLVETEDETFMPAYSPDGKEIAYLKERTGIEIMTLANNAKRTILDERINYSYSDGDQWFQWSPDGKWLAINYLDNDRWMSDIAIVKTDGKSKPVNLTESGYNEFSAHWMNKGNILLFISDRYGLRAQASWGAHGDILAVYLNQKVYDKFNLKREEYELLYGEKKDGKKDDKKDDTKEEPVEDIVIETGNVKDRVERLTRHSSSLSGAVLSMDGSKLYYLSKFEKGYDLWQQDLVKHETKLLTKLGSGAGGLVMDKKGKNLYAIDGGKIIRFELSGEKAEKKSVSFKSEMELDPYGERRYMFEHAWKQVSEKFYVEDLHGIDWQMYHDAYEKFLPHINNGPDFAEMLGEMLGELNASHTGGRYRPHRKNTDQTASFGLLYNWDHTGDGLKIDEVIEGGPVVKDGSKIKAGVIITAINGNVLKAGDNYNRFLTGLKDQPTLLSLQDPKTKEKWTETIRPISLGAEHGLLYKRWVKRNQAFTEEYSKGRIAYVHVQGMNEASYRAVYSDLMGRYHDYDAVVVDTRFNGGGWLHDDLATLLSGKPYMRFSPRKQENIGQEPMFKWKQPSIVVMGEGNYSDAHMFPYTYRALGIGKLVGMPVPGTGTAVWWELQIDGATIFGIPQVGMIGNDGKYLENQDLNPDIKVSLDPHTVVDGDDKQLKQAIDELMITGDRDH